MRHCSKHFTFNNSFNSGIYFLSYYAQTTDKKIRRVELDNEPNWNDEHEYKNKQIKN